MKEELLAKIEFAMDNYRQKFAVVRHQQSLLYQDYTREKQVQVWCMTQKLPVIINARVSTEY